MERRPQRSDAKARHRQALIDATIASIAEHGFAGTSVTRIINRAGLSRGMVHLHFASKQDLLLEAARYMNRTYYDKQKNFLNSAGGRPQDQLAAIITADLSEEILNSTSVNAWYAFRGEARSHNSFAKYSDTRDEKLRHMMFVAFLALAKNSSKSEALAKDVTYGAIALLEGMWTDFLLHYDEFDREGAKRIIFSFLAAIFPDYFDREGAKS